MTPQVATKEEVVAEPNTETVVFRVPKSMKQEFKLLCEFQQYASVGELLRALYREHRNKIFNQRGFHYWMERKEAERASQEKRF